MERAEMGNTGLNITLRPSSPQSSLEAHLFKEIDDGDLALLESQGDLSRGEVGLVGRATRGLRRLRDTHHALARLIAVGSSNIEASALTGYDPGYISVLKADPAFKELVAHYRANLDLAQTDIVARMSGLSASFLAELQQRLEDDPEKLSNNFVLEALKVLLDRTGHAPVSKTINVNVDLASRLEAARRRIGGPSGPSGPELALEANSGGKVGG
jgi:hypothetical protein